VFERMTIDARSVIARIPRTAADRRRMTLRDLAAALSVPTGNTAGLWHAPATEPSVADSGNVDVVTADVVTSAAAVPTSATGGPSLRFDGEGRRVLEEALVIALQEWAYHIGTEHLLAAMVRTGPPDVVATLAARGATVEAVDALLVRLHGGLGVERVPAAPSRAGRRTWRRRTAQVHGYQRIPRPLAIVAVVLAAAMVFVLCVWGP
jgi:hypothetical protein